MGSRIRPRFGSYRSHEQLKGREEWKGWGCTECPTQDRSSHVLKSQGESCQAEDAADIYGIRCLGRKGPQG